MKKIIFRICIMGSALFLLTACGKKKDTPVSKNNTTTTKTTTAATEPVTTEPERTKIVRLSVTNGSNGLEVKILDENQQKIENLPFTVCFVNVGNTPIRDSEQSATVSGEEFSDTQGTGTIVVDSQYLDSGNYEVYLRPIDEYIYAEPIPLSYVVYKFDENIEEKIVQSENVDLEREDKSYIAQEAIEAQKKKNAVKVNNMISSGFILGNSKKFRVNIPVLNENDDVMYEKLNAIEADSSLELSEYIKENNLEELIVGGEVKKMYVYEERRFDQRIDDYYVSKAILKEGGKTYIYTLVPHMKESVEDVYVGWYSKKGKHYYNDENGYPVTGWQKIDELWYYFDDDGRKASITGVDVSEYQEDIDWQALKDSGIDFAIIRCGFRGYETGVLVEDAKFKENIQRAKEVGMPFGVYIFSQAINQVEAAEEASMILQLCKNYEPDLPFAMDIEACGDEEVEGRQNKLSAAQRTMVINTFVDVIESQGKEAMLYSNKHWIENQMYIDQIDCKLWYAMWPGEDENDPDAADAPNNDAYETDPDKIPNMPCEIWQYSSKGVVDGIEPLVDLNAWVPSLE